VAVRGRRGSARALAHGSMKSPALRGPQRGAGRQPTLVQSGPVHCTPVNSAGSSLLAHGELRPSMGEGRGALLLPSAPAVPSWRPPCPPPMSAQLHVTTAAAGRADDEFGSASSIANTGWALLYDASSGSWGVGTAGQ
jgi:hypothetical protein